jgi:hypothetical protein
MKLTRTLTAVSIISTISFLPLLQPKASAQDFAAEQQAICAQFDAGKSVQQLASDWATYVENQIAANQFSAEEREQAYQAFGNLLSAAVTNYCPRYTEALIEAQSAASAGYQPPSTTCNFNVASQSPNNSTFTNAGNAWVNWFNNFGGRWMPRITGRSTQELYGC